MNNERTKGLTQELNKRDRYSTVWRWSFIGNNNINYGTLQGIGYAWSITKTLRKIYPDDDSYVGAMGIEYEYLNITPYIGPLIADADIALQEQQGTESLRTVHSVETSLMSPLSGIRDSLLWVLYPTIMGSISGYMALEGNPLGAIIWIILNLGLIWMRLKLFDLGYESEIRLIASMADKFNAITESASVIGLTVVGSLITTVVKVYTPIEPTFGKVTIGLQAEVFDHILPALLPVLLTALIHFLVEKKRWGSLEVIFLLFAFSLLEAYFGFLGVAP